MLLDHLRRIILTTLLVAGAMFMLAQPAYAADPLADACKSNPDSATCQSLSPDTNPLTGKNGLLYKVSAIVATITGIAAIIVIIVSGLRFITAGGDAQKAAGARKVLLGAIIGLVIIVLAQTIITFVVRKL